MDLALLGSTLRANDDEREKTAAATTAVVGVAVLDVLCARRLSRGEDAGSAASGDGGIRGLEAHSHGVQYAYDRAKQAMMLERPTARSRCARRSCRAATAAPSR